MELVIIGVIVLDSVSVSARSLDGCDDDSLEIERGFRYNKRYVMRNSFWSKNRDNNMDGINQAR